MLQVKIDNELTTCRDLLESKKKKVLKRVSFKGFSLETL